MRSRWLMFPVAVVVTAVLVYPYLGLDPADSRVDLTGIRYHVLVGHIFTAAVAWWSGNPLTQVGLTTAAVLWLVTAALAFRAARRRDHRAHRDWMTRNYALTFLAVTARALVPLLLLGQYALGATAPVADRVATAIPIGQTLAWILNLAAAEIIIRRGRPRRPAWNTIDTCRSGSG